MATPIKPTPKLSHSEWQNFTQKLEANRNNKVSASKKAEMRSLVERVLSNKK